MSQAPAPPLAVLTASDLHRWVLRTCRLLEQHRDRIDELNVFPVPDGDTGTNMYLTVHSALAHSTPVGAAVGEPLSTLTGSFASTMLMHARGNSGVIISQLLRGVAEALAHQPQSGGGGIDGPGLAACLATAGRFGWEAVARPVAGTILSVVDGAAESAARHIAECDTLEAVSVAALEGARESLQRTPTQLESLARAGVVDAGGAGFVLVMEALVDVVRHHGTAPHDDVYPRSSTLHKHPPATDGHHLCEVMAVVKGCSDAQRDALRDVLSALGNSVVVAGDDSACTLHLHTHDAGAAVEAALPFGALSGIRITCLESAHGGVDTRTQPPASTAQCGLVVSAWGAGLERAYTQSGAVTVASRPHLRATPHELYDAAVRLRTPGVVIVPTSPDIVMAAHAACDRLSAEGIAAHVVQAVDHAQGLAAVSLFDPQGEAEDVAEAMEQAARSVRSGEVVVATRRAFTEAGPCQPGDIIGYIGGVAHTIGHDLCAVLCEIVATLVGEGAEVITVVTGEAAGSHAASLVDAVAAAYPGCDVTHIAGGQPVHAVVVGVE